MTRIHNVNIKTIVLDVKDYHKLLDTGEVIIFDDITEEKIYIKMNY